MREILFRGKTFITKKMVMGTGILYDGTNTWIVNNEPPNALAFGTEHYTVDPSTIGQYTGLTDKNGKKIFEGDICKVTRHCILCYGSITFKKGSFWFDEFNTDSVLELSKLEINNFEIKIIGNIHDNPELLKECEGK